MKKAKKQNLRRHSFTLIEVVIVIVILVTLASIATPMYMNYVKNANIGAAKSQKGGQMGDVLIGELLL